MKYKNLGITNISVSEFALDCWPFAGGDFLGYQKDKTETKRIFSNNHG